MGEGSEEVLPQAARGWTSVDALEADAVRFERRGTGERERLRLEFLRGGERVALAPGLDVDGALDAVGPANFARIMRAGEARGVLEGQRLSAFEGSVPEGSREREGARFEPGERVTWAHRPRGGYGYEIPVAARVVRQSAQRVRIELLDLAGDEPERVERSVAPESLRRDRARFVEGLDPESEREELTRSGAPERLEPNEVGVDREGLARAEREREAPPGETPEAREAAERARRERELEGLGERFRIEGRHYRFRDGRREIAFTDRGSRLTTATNDERAARAIAQLADARGWSAIRVRGHDAFRREVWLEASARGLTVSGYRASEQDLAELARRREPREPNVAERETVRPEASPAREGAPLEGVLLEHGAAPYRGDPDASPSYRVALDGPKGPRELWGADLERAMAEAGAEVGDRVALAREGRRAVTVDRAARDEAGRVVDTEKAEALRTSWRVRVLERRRSLEALADAFAERHGEGPAEREALRRAIGESIAERERRGERLPPVPVYDRAAAPRRGLPARAVERGRAAEHVRSATEERAR